MTITELETPALLADQSIMEENAAVMKSITAGSRMRLFPHYKSHKCPMIAKKQMELGAGGITCAKLGEADDLVREGIPTVVIANQVVQSEKLPLLASLARRAHLTVCADDEENILALERAMAEGGGVLHVLVEYEVGMRRCGAESFEEVLRLAQLIGTQPHLSFHGIQAYAGQLSHEEDGETRRREVLRIETEAARLKGYLEERGVLVPNVCGGSTGYAAEKPEDTVYTQLQAGSYLFMDSSYQRLNLPFRQALYVLTSVVSVKPDRVVVDCGVKTLTMDQHAPYFPAFPEAELSFSEEHTTIFTENSDLLPGDMLLCVPGHCCTTVNTFDRIHVIRGEDVLHVWPITSRGKAQ